jgi:hypothetical protein
LINPFQFTVIKTILIIIKQFFGKCSDLKTIQGILK